MVVKQEEKNKPSLDFSKLRLGTETFKDAALSLSNFIQNYSRDYDNRASIIKAIADGDIETQRSISQYYYRVSGIYSRLCRYLAYLYRFDWMVTPYRSKNSRTKSSKKAQDSLVDKFFDVLYYLEDSEIKKLLGEISLKVIKNGCYYGYRIDLKDRFIVQELPPQYCRSTYKRNGRPIVEFNLKFFDAVFKNEEERIRALDAFPEEIKKAYLLACKNKLKPINKGERSPWFVLDPDHAFKFNINENDQPYFVAAIPAIIDLCEAQELDKKKMAQQLLKIIIQKMPIDKNGDLIFDLDEVAQLHKNAVQMLGRAIGIDILTTFADVDVADMSDSRTTATTDELEKMERAVFNASGVSQNNFNTTGNTALEKSILNDEASIYNLILQYESFLNDSIKQFADKKTYKFRLQMLSTTIYNYKEMSKLYKEQTQLGYSKMLPEIALGQAQSTILETAYFENDVLDLVHVFIPPLMSSTMNIDALKTVTGNKDVTSEEKTAGRKELDDDKKSDKTLANREAQG